MIGPLLLHLGWFGPVWADPVQDRQVVAAVRALAYDRKLSERSGSSLDVVVVHAGGATMGEADRIGTVLAGLGDFKIQGVPLRISVVESARFLDRSVGADVVMLPAGLGTAADAIVSSAASQKVFVAGFDLDYLPRGAALVVVTNGEQLRLVVDLAAARAAGALFSSQLLQLAELYP